MSAMKPTSPRWLGALSLALSLAACDVAVVAPRPPELALIIDGVEARPGEVIDLGALTLDPAAAQPPTLRLALRLENRGGDPVDLASRPPLRVRDDPTLAFRTAQPPIDSLAPGQSAQGQVIFAPSFAGAFSARLTLVTDPPLDPPLVIQLQARAAAPERADIVALALEDEDGEAVDVLDFGTAPLGASREWQLTVVNTGNVPLARSALRAALAPDSGVFKAVFGDELDVLAPSASLGLTVSASSSSCGTFAARLEVGTASGGALASAALGFTSGSVSLRVKAFVEPVAAGLRALGRLGVGQPGLGRWRIVTGEPEAAGGDGGLRWIDFDGCVVGESQRLRTPAGTSPGWGQQAATDASGDLAVASWPDLPKVSVVPLDPGDVELSGATLGTQRVGEGFGQAVLVSSGAEVVVVGQPEASNGIARHGVAVLYQRPLLAWADLAAPTLRLTPSVTGRAIEVGSVLAASRKAELVLAGGRVAAGSGHEPAAWVWRSTVGVSTGLTWGRRLEGGEADQRIENQLLRAGETDSAGAIQLAASTDGDVVLLAHQLNVAVTRVHIFLRSGSAFGDGGSEVEPDRSFDVPGRAVLALSPDGGSLVVATSDQSLRLARMTPEGGDWRTGPLGRQDLAALRPEGDAGLLTRLSLSPDGVVLAGLTDSGDLELIRLPAPAP